MQTQRKGNRAEQLARIWLEAKGLRFIEKNYAAKTGEIDLIMQDAQTLVFIEVRYRKRNFKQSLYGGGTLSVDHRKQRKLLQTVRHYLQRQSHRTNAGSSIARIDVLDISGSLDNPTFRWIQNAVSEAA